MRKLPDKDSIKTINNSIKDKAKTVIESVKNKPKGFTQSFFDYEAILNGIIKTNRGKYVKILEVTGCDYILSPLEIQHTIADSFSSLFATSRVNFRIKVVNKRDNPQELINRLKAKNANPNEKSFTDERREDYERYVNTLLGEESNTKRYFFIFEYEGETAGLEDVEIINNFQIEINSIVTTLESAYCTVVPDCIDNEKNSTYTAQILYELYNEKSSLFESFEQRMQRVNTDVMMHNFADPENPVEIEESDVIAPRGIAFEKEYAIIDGVYYKYLTVMGNSIPQIMAPAGNSFLDILNDQNIDYDIVAKRKFKEQIKSSLDASERLKNSVTSDKNKNEVELEQQEGYIKELNSIRYAIANNEDYWNVVIVITLKNESLKDLNIIERSLKNELKKSPHFISLKETYCNAENIFKFLLPTTTVKDRDPFFIGNSRGFVTSSFTALMPFRHRTEVDASGCVLGINAQTGRYFAYNPFNRELINNANIAIVGCAGSGKTFSEEVLSSRMYHMRNGIGSNAGNGYRIFFVCPIKGHEYKNLCKSLDGTFCDLSKDNINLFDIRPEKKNRLDTNEVSLLTKKIAQIITFIELSYPSLTQTEEDILNVLLMKMYADFGITDNNQSIFEEDGVTLKKMPIFSDLYNVILSSDKASVMENILNHLSVYIKGQFSYLNGYTTVDLTKRCIVIDCDEEKLGRNRLPSLMYLGFSTLTSIIKTDNSSEDLLCCDEAWKFFVGGKNGGSRVAEELMSTAKVIRGLKGSLLLSTQDITDFLGNEYGKKILNQCPTKIIKQVIAGDNNQNECYAVCEACGLDYKTYGNFISGFKKSEALVITPRSFAHVIFVPTFSELAIFGSDADTDRFREFMYDKNKWGTSSFKVTREDVEEAVYEGVNVRSWLDNAI